MPVGSISAGRRRSATSGGSGYSAYRVYIVDNNGAAQVAIDELYLRSTNGGSSIVTTLASDDGRNFASRTWFPGATDPWKMFDGSTAGAWASDVTTNQYAGRRLTSAQVVSQFAMICSNNTRAPKNFRLEGSNDTTDGTDGTWTTLGSSFTKSDWVSGDTSAYSFTVDVLFNSDPFISGTATVGSTLTCNTSIFPASGYSVSYQWKRNGTNISGATSSTYVTVSGDNLTFLTCAVTITTATNNETRTTASFGIGNRFVATSASYSGGWSQTGGVISASSASNRIEAVGILTSGNTYNFTITGTKTAGAKLRIRTETNTDIYLSNTLANGSMNISGTFVANGSNFRLEADTAIFSGSGIAITII